MKCEWRRRCGGVSKVQHQQQDDEVGLEFIFISSRGILGLESLSKLVAELDLSVSWLQGLGLFSYFAHSKRSTKGLKTWKTCEKLGDTHLVRFAIGYSQNWGALSKKQWNSSCWEWRTPNCSFESFKARESIVARKIYLSNMHWAVTAHCTRTWYKEHYKKVEDSDLHEFSNTRRKAAVSKTSQCSV